MTYTCDDLCRILETHLNELVKVVKNVKQYRSYFKAFGMFKFSALPTELEQNTHILQFLQGSPHIIIGYSWTVNV